MTWETVINISSGQSTPNTCRHAHTQAFTEKSFLRCLFVSCCFSFCWVWKSCMRADAWTVMFLEPCAEEARGHLPAECITVEHARWTPWNAAAASVYRLCRTCPPPCSSQSVLSSVPLLLRGQVGRWPQPTASPWELCVGVCTCSLPQWLCPFCHATAFPSLENTFFTVALLWTCCGSHTGHAGSRW